MELAIELGTSDQRYAVVHKLECRHLVDPEPIGSANALDEIPDLVEQATGWEHDDIQSIAPCVKLPKSEQ